MSKIKVLATLVLSSGYGGKSSPCSLLASGSCWKSFPSFGLWQHNFILYSCHQMMFSVHLSVSVHISLFLHGWEPALIQYDFILITKELDNNKYINQRSCLWRKCLCYLNWCFSFLPIFYFYILIHLLFVLEIMCVKWVGDMVPLFYVLKSEL